MNFSLILFLICLVTGAFWLLERLVWRRQRPAGAPRPAWLEYTAGFFPLLSIVFLFRSFLFEPFNIPSGSMIPTLRIGDMILVQKYSYGIRLPIANQLIIPLGKPERGDVAVFRYPKDESLDYIKRIVGLPGDVIAYENKQLFINGEPVQKRALGPFLGSNGQRPAQQYEEVLGEKRYTTLNDPGDGGFYFVEAFAHRENCERSLQGMRCTVPAGHYFVLGDNRDNSADSRIWGFVPDRNLAGRAVVVWFNLDDILAGRFDRLGSIE